jgi:hypothetical protein
LRESGKILVFLFKKYNKRKYDRTKYAFDQALYVYSFLFIMLVCTSIAGLDILLVKLFDYALNRNYLVIALVSVSLGMYLYFNSSTFKKRAFRYVLRKAPN